MYCACCLWHVLLGTTKMVGDRPRFKVYVYQDAGPAGVVSLIGATVVEVRLVWMLLTATLKVAQLCCLGVAGWWKTLLRRGGPSSILYDRQVP